MTCIPVRRGYWGNNIGQPHTVPIKVTGKCGSVTVRLIPAPRGAGIVAARVPKKVLQMAGIDDCYTASRGSTKTLGNFVKVCFTPALSVGLGLLELLAEFGQFGDSSILCTMTVLVASPVLLLHFLRGQPIYHALCT